MKPKQQISFQNNATNDLPGFRELFERVKAKANKGAIVNINKDENEILIYDEIQPWAINAQDVVSALGQMDSDSELIVRIASPGGDVNDGIAIYNRLREHKGGVVVYVDGMAASIASVIAMAGDRIIMSENAQMMIHNPSTVVFGDSQVMRKRAETLDVIKDAIITTYQTRVSIDRDEISDMMDQETWMTAAEAVELGFATEVLQLNDEKAAAAENLIQKFDLSTFRNAPNRSVKPKTKARAKTPASKAETRSTAYWRAHLTKLQNS